MIDPIVLAIDPGPEKSAWVLYDGRRVLEAGIEPNTALRQRIHLHTIRVSVPIADFLAIENIESMGMAVGAEVFETVFWTGRFLERWGDLRSARVTRREVKLHLCGSMRAKDANVRQRLIDLLGAPGTKKAQGGTYGVTSHCWAALAVAYVWWDTKRPLSESENK